MTNDEFRKIESEDRITAIEIVEMSDEEFLDYVSKINLECSEACRLVSESFDVLVRSITDLRTQILKSRTAAPDSQGE